MLREAPYTEPYVRCCGRVAAVRPQNLTDRALPDFQPRNDAENAEPSGVLISLFATQRRSALFCVLPRHFF